MKVTLNNDTLFDTDDVNANIQDLFARFAPFTSFSREAFTHLDDFTLRSLLRKTTAKRDTLNDALAMIQAEQTRRQTSPVSNVPEKL